MGDFGSKIDPKTTPLLMDVEEEKLEFGEKGPADCIPIKKTIYEACLFFS
jgi:hypothetical protein